MKLIFYKIDKIKVLKLIGEITINEIKQLYKVMDSIPQSERFVGIDFSETLDINSFILTALSKLNNKLQENKGRLLIYSKNSEGRIHRVFELIGFTQIIDFAHDYETFEKLCQEFSKSV